LHKVDLVVESGQVPEVRALQPVFQQSLQASEWTAVSDFSSHMTIESLQGRPLLAMAGIGHPQRFFQTVEAMGLTCETKVFADHHAYTPEDFIELTGKTILMTEKDAVKCRHLGLIDAWFLPVSAELTPVGHLQTLTDCVISLLKQRKGNMK
jgi:tetraacyldisaccharide 4'-kinase